MSTLIDSHEFMSNYHGHDIRLLREYHHKMVSTGRNTIWLAGDSTLDNKFWVKEQYHLPYFLNDVFESNYLKGDVATFLNSYLETTNYYCLNCAVEEATLGQKTHLNEQDLFLRDHLQPDDILVVCIGGNDVALRPSLTTIYNLILCLKTNTNATLTQRPEQAWGLSHFVKLFKEDLTRYINKLTDLVKPKKIIICMLYYPDEKQTGGWADKTLGYLEYNTNPGRLQLLIRQIYNLGLSKIKIPDVEVCPCPLFEYLNGKDTNDYVQRVEPSCSGSRKIASAILKLL